MTKSKRAQRLSNLLKKRKESSAVSPAASPAKAKKGKKNHEKSSAKAKISTTGVGADLIKASDTRISTASESETPSLASTRSGNASDVVSSEPEDAVSLEQELKLFKESIEKKEVYRHLSPSDKWKNVTETGKANPKDSTVYRAVLLALDKKSNAPKIKETQDVEEVVEARTDKSVDEIKAICTRVKEVRECLFLNGGKIDKESFLKMSLIDRFSFSQSSRKENKNAFQNAVNEIHEAMSVVAFSRSYYAVSDKNTSLVHIFSKEGECIDSVQMGSKDDVAELKKEYQTFIIESIDKDFPSLRNPTPVRNFIFNYTTSLKSKWWGHGAVKAEHPDYQIPTGEKRSKKAKESEANVEDKTVELERKRIDPNDGQFVEKFIALLNKGNISDDARHHLAEVAETILTYQNEKMPLEKRAIDFALVETGKKIKVACLFKWDGSVVLKYGEKKKMYTPTELCVVGGTTIYKK